MQATSEAAALAGAFAMRHYRTGVAVETKGDGSPVTIADKNAEKLTREAVSAAFPGDGFLGEEFGDQPGTSGFRWIIDPIDGTRDFIRGNAQWGVLLGLE